MGVRKISLHIIYGLRRVYINTERMMIPLAVSLD